MKTNRIPVYFALMALSNTLFSCGNNSDNRELAASDSAVVVSVSKPTATSSDNNIDVSGQIESKSTANISTRVMGYINRIYVNIGDRVSKGQKLVSINASDISAKRAQADAMISQAEAAFASAQKDFDRYNALYQKQSATAKELENATLQYKAARANLESAKQVRNEASAQFNYTNITAPFSGVVTQKLADAGSMATPGMPILTIEQNGNLQVTASVPESEIGLVKQNNKATIQIKSTGKTLDGQVTEISQSSQYTGGQYIIKVNIPEKDKTDLYAGMYVNVSLQVEKSSSTYSDPGVVLVPKTAIINKDQLTGLYTVSNNNTALLRWVRLGNDYGNQVEVLSGLSKEETFITRINGQLYNGVALKIQ